MSNEGMTIYNKTFFENQQTDSLASAKQIIPIIVQALSPTSVVDVGCGVGTWLSVVKTEGVTDLLGIDGDYVDRDMLFIPKDLFMAHDLKLPLNVPRRFDLVMSLETAEHLPPHCAQAFVESLSRLGDVVLFSAAVPGQARDHGVHLNEQWPDYWAALFRELGFEPIDFIRRRIWSDERVCWWYAQNLLLYVKSAQFAKYAPLQYPKTASDDRLTALSMVHPRFFRQYADYDAMSLQRKLWILRRLLKSMGRGVLHKLIG
jgi:SAM-dependent methyltransferase